MGEDTTLGDMPSPAADVLVSLIDYAEGAGREYGPVSDCGDVATAISEDTRTGGRFLLTCVRIPRA